MNEKVMRHYNELWNDANRLHSLVVEKWGVEELICGVTYARESERPSDHKEVAEKIEACILRHYPAAAEQELRTAASEKRQAKSWQRNAAGCGFWIYNGNLGGIGAVRAAQEEIRQILAESARLRQERYERYRVLVEQGVALPPGDGSN